MAIDIIHSVLETAPALNVMYRTTDAKGLRDTPTGVIRACFMELVRKVGVLQLEVQELKDQVKKLQSPDYSI